ncbi:hypothetical protein O6H91_06G007400 [Diphasiastrum complanatum]|uniref:Uncharacterized protein n=1 Tax=Diphasiastrum complanatum TaxID=34168 RepID=A0ACC2DBB1_DIPCM|nr:hypothetical protein O6H91_06G007400 [Diphasiastrum complanatum]
MAEKTVSFRWLAVVTAILLELLSDVKATSRSWADESRIVMPGITSFTQKGISGTKWAVLIAGSSGYGNYRHQADVCHAYQLLRKGGLKEENIVVFMYDDIANSFENPRPGVIINNPQGSDVYHGVPKDYTGANLTVDNFYAVIRGDRAAIQGGSGKVVDSGPDDYIFIFYSDHGGPGVLGMPTTPNIYANDFVDVLKEKHAAGTYKEMAIYLEACESGSIFEGLLPEGLNIYATTASNAEESSWGTYCPGMYPPPPPEFMTCLGDLYSVAWMEDSEVHNLNRETLEDQYLSVKTRTSNHNTYSIGSHVMQYGDTKFKTHQLSAYLGFDPANENVTRPHALQILQMNKLFLEPTESVGINQRDADLLHLWQKYHRAAEGSQEKMRIGKEIFDVIGYRIHLDDSMQLIGKLLFGNDVGPIILKAVRPAGKPLVDDWGCLKRMVRTYESQCGLLTQYGMKHMRALANICNAGVDTDKMASVAAKACVRSSFPREAWAPIQAGFSA